MCASVLLLPAVLLRSIGPGADAPRYDVSAGAAASTTSTWVSPGRILSEPVTTVAPLPSSPSMTRSAPQLALAAPTTTTVTRAVVGSTSTSSTSTSSTSIVGATTTTAPAAAPKPTTTTVAPTTTTTRLLVLPALTQVTPAEKYAHTERGLASWFNAPDGTCAHRTAPKGTVIKVTRTSTGESVRCTVADWGPEDRSRVIDLSMDTFELLQYSSAGLMDVQIEW